MPVSLTYSQRTTYIGDTAIFNGATFIWNGTEYIETGLIQIDNPLLNNRKVVIQFNAKLIQTSRSSTTTLSAGFLDVYVDNVQWDEEQIYRTDAYLEVTFDESFLRTQKIVTFQSKQGESRTRFAVRSNVYTDSDVVVVKYDVIDPEPKIGDSTDIARPTRNVRRFTTRQDYKQTFANGLARFNNLEVTLVSPFIGFPIDVSVTEITGTEATITWNTTSETSYTIKFVEPNCPPDGCVLKSEILTSNHVVKLQNLKVGTDYKFSIESVSVDNEKYTSNEVSFSTIGSFQQPPTTQKLPTILSQIESRYDWDVRNDFSNYNFALAVSADTEFVKGYLPSRADVNHIGYFIFPADTVPITDQYPEGKRVLISFDWPGGLGTYESAFVPSNNVVGDGIPTNFLFYIKRVLDFPQPDITGLEFSRFITESDFKDPFQYSFQFKGTSVNSQFIEVFVGQVTDASLPITKVPVDEVGNFDITIPAQEIYNINPNAFTEGKDLFENDTLWWVVSFSIRPSRGGVNTMLYGNTEIFTSYVKRSQLTLSDSEVIEFIATELEKRLRSEYSNLLLFDNDKHLKYQLKQIDPTADSFVVSNIAKDDVTFSVGPSNGWSGGVPPRLNNSIPLNWYKNSIVETTFDIDPLTGDTIRVQSTPYPTLVVKLLDPLPAEIGVNTQFWVSKQLIPTIVEDIVLSFEDDEACIVLQPNFGIDVLDETGYQYYNEIIASGSLTSTDIVNKYLSQSALNLSDLSIAYTSGSVVTSSTFLLFDNFVNFSSAETRVDNFQYKLSAIEFWRNKISSSLYVGNSLADGVYTKATSQSYIDSINQIVNGFDGFEKEMYSTYYITSSNAEFFSYQIPVAQEYDKQNKNYLVRHLPYYLHDGANSGENEEFVLFVEMVGQHFDVLWSYIRGLHNKNVIRNVASDSIPDKLVQAMLENLGWDSAYPFSGYELWREAFGLNADGTSVTNTNLLGNSITPAYTPESGRKQIWRRLLNNLPYLLKHKGTKRSVKAIMSCYGIPESLLSVVEFAAPSKQTASASVELENYTYTTTTSRLNVVTSSNVSVPYYNLNTESNAVQLRFATSYQVSTATSTTGSQLIRMVPDGGGGYWQVNIKPTQTGSFADVVFTLASGSSTLVSRSLSITSSVIYDDYWKNLTIQKERFVSASVTYDKFTMYVVEALDDRIIMNQSNSFITASSGFTNTFTKTGSLYFNGYLTTPGISGGLDEIRVWNTAISESVIYSHALNPDTIYGNGVYDTTDNLLVRLDFEYPKNRVSDPYVKNVSPKVTFSASVAIGGYAGYATASMGYTATSYPYHYSVYERTATSQLPKMGLVAGDKVRFINQSLVSDLSPISRATQPITELAPIDVNKLGLFFSPVKEINLDILNSLGKINIGDYIGSWEDEYGVDRYRDLDSLRQYYFKRTNFNFYEYIKLVKSIDKSFYDMIKQLIPSRVNVVTGILIEPSILERSKIKITKPKGEKILHTASINYIEHLVLDGENQVYDAIFDDLQLDKTFDVEVSSLTSIIPTATMLTTSAEYLSYTSSYDVYSNLNIETSIIYSSGSNGGSIEGNINAKYIDSTVLGEYDLEDSYQNVGTDVDSPYLKGFGVYGENGAVDRTYRRADGTLVLTERSNAYILTIRRDREVPNTDYDGITTYPTASKFEKKLVFVSQSDANAGGAFRSPSAHSFYTTINAALGTYPYDKGVVTLIELFNGYTTGHYRFTKDTTRGLENSYFNGSKQTSLTTLDGTPAVEVFATNPNTLKVTNSGRGSGEPILEVT
jgi:hypothetical protein